MQDEPWGEQLRFLRSNRGEGPMPSPPVDGLTLDWIHNRNAGNIAKYFSNGDAIYDDGSIVVKVSTDDEGRAIQEYFMGHEGRVTRASICASQIVALEIW